MRRYDLYIGHFEHVSLCHFFALKHSWKSKQYSCRYHGMNLSIAYSEYSYSWIVNDRWYAKRALQHSPISMDGLAASNIDFWNHTSRHERLNDFTLDEAMQNMKLKPLETRHCVPVAATTLQWLEKVATCLKEMVQLFLISVCRGLRCPLLRLQVRHRLTCRNRSQRCTRPCMGSMASIVNVRWRWVVFESAQRTRKS